MKNGSYEMIIAPEGYTGKLYRGKYAGKYSKVSQLAESLTVNQVVGGSIPPFGAK